MGVRPPNSKLWSSVLWSDEEHFLDWVEATRTNHSISIPDLTNALVAGCNQILTAVLKQPFQRSGWIYVGWASSWMWVLRPEARKTPAFSISDFLLSMGRKLILWYYVADCPTIKKKSPPKHLPKWLCSVGHVKVCYLGSLKKAQRGWKLCFLFVWTADLMLKWINCLIFPVALYLQSVCSFSTLDLSVVFWRGRGAAGREE